MVEEEYLIKCVVNPMSKKFHLHSNQGTEKFISCETTQQFMDVLKLVRSLLDESTLEYEKPF